MRLKPQATLEKADHADSKLPVVVWDAGQGRALGRNGWSGEEQGSYSARHCHLGHMLLLYMSLNVTMSNPSVCCRTSLEQDASHRESTWGGGGAIRVSLCRFFFSVKLKLL